MHRISWKYYYIEVLKQKKDEQQSGIRKLAKNKSKTGFRKIIDFS